MRVSSPALQ
uniref:Uncharacterized protein n=1 Tax=Anguilla anguilla TaxID=7936 RepID=A0A0E9TCA1_ANGAN